MASSSADCVLGGVRLISSASSTLAKIGPGHEGPGAASGAGVFFDDVGAGDIGRHQVGGELDALETPAPGCCASVRTSSVLAVPGKPGDQAVAADEQRDHHLLNHFFLADDHAVNLGHDLVAHFLKSRDAVLQVAGV